MIATANNATPKHAMSVAELSAFPRTESSPNKPNFTRMAAGMNCTAVTARKNGHSNFQSFLKMCQTISESFRLDGAFARGSRQCSENGTQTHRLGIDITNAGKQRLYTLSQ